MHKLRVNENCWATALPQLCGCACFVHSPNGFSKATAFSRASPTEIWKVQTFHIPAATAQIVNRKWSITSLAVTALFKFGSLLNFSPNPAVKCLALWWQKLNSVMHFLIHYSLATVLQQTMCSFQLDNSNSISWFSSDLELDERGSWDRRTSLNIWTFSIPTTSSFSQHY